MRSRRSRAPSEPIQDADRPLFEVLRAWRREQASAQAVPPYVIFPDRTLMDIARLRPETADMLALCSGVGQAKLARYGEAVIRLVRDH